MDPLDSLFDEEENDPPPKQTFSSMLNPPKPMVQDAARVQPKKRKPAHDPLDRLFMDSDATHVATGRPVLDEIRARRPDTIREVPGSDNLVKKAYRTVGISTLPKEPKTPAGRALSKVAHVAGIDDPLSAIEGPGRAAMIAATGADGARFFSQLERAIASAPEKATGRQFLSHIQKNKGALSKVEREYTGINRFLEENADNVLHRDEVVAKAKEKPLKVEETVKRDLPPPSQEARNAKANELYGKNYDELSPDFAGRVDSDIRAATKIPASEIRDRAKFSSYAEPGGENYREIVLKKEGGKARTSEDYADLLNDLRAKYGEDDWFVRSTPEERSHLEELRGIAVGRPDPLTYKSDHFPDQPGYLSHLRVQDRKLPNGEKWLEVAESQSDRAQEARKLGRKADMPYAKTEEWTALNLKRAIDEAARGGYTGITLNTGEQQIARYDLSKEISDLWYDPAGHKLIARDKNGGKTIERYVAKEELPEYIGKDATDKLLATTPQRVGDKQVAHILTGEDLKIGGEGMKKYYDEIIPNVVRDYAKKMGVQIEMAPHPEIANQLSFKLPDDLRARVLSEGQPLGIAHPGVVAHLAGGGAGAAGGAAVDDEHPVRGAVIGTLAGLAGGAAVAKAISHKPGIGAEAFDEAVDLATRPHLAVEGAAPVVDPLAINAADHINIAKFDVTDPVGLDRLKAEVQRVAATDRPHGKGLDSWNDVRERAAKITEQLGLEPSDVRIMGKDARLAGDEMLAIRNIVSRNIEEITQESAKLNAPLSIAERENITHRIAMLDNQNEHMLSKFIKSRTQTGRDLNNLKIIANATMDPFVWMEKAQRIAGTKLPEDAAVKIRALIESGDRAGLIKYVSSLRSVSGPEKLTTAWKSMLLTRTTTHLANTIGNISMASLETAKDAPAYLWDQLISKTLGTAPTKAAPGAWTLKASLRGAQRGAIEAKQVLRGMPIGDALTKYDLTRGEINFGNDLVNVFINGPYRLLGASDRVFRGIAFRRSLEEQARVIAQRAGLRGPAFKIEVERLLSAPSDEMALRAIGDAEVATFMDNSALARIGSGIKRGAKRAGEIPGAFSELLLPFVKTPANVVTRVVEYSPFGAAGGMLDVSRVMRLARQGAGDAKIFAVQKRAVERLGRSSVGLAAIMAGYALHQQGLMTTGRKKDPSEAATDQLLGVQPASIKIGNEWRSVTRISPLGNLMQFGAYLSAAAQNPETATAGEALATAGASIGKTVTEQSFLQGAKQTTESIDDPLSAGARQLESMAGSVVPGFVAQAAQALDPIVRQTRGETMGEEIANKIKSRIPGVSKTLEPKRDQFGEEITRAGGAVGTYLNPMFGSIDKTDSDKLLAEIERTGATITSPKRLDGETAKQYSKRVEIEGKRLRASVEKVTTSPRYTSQYLASQEYPDVTKAEALKLWQKDQIEGAVRKARAKETSARKKQKFSELLNAR